MKQKITLFARSLGGKSLSYDMLAGAAMSPSRAARLLDSGAVAWLVTHKILAPTATCSNHPADPRAGNGVTVIYPSGKRQTFRAALPVCD